MKIAIYICALAPLALAGCADEPVVTTTTTQVRSDVVEPGAPVVTREIYVAQAPPAVRVESRTVSPGPGYVWVSGHWRWTGAEYVWVQGSWLRQPRPTGVWVAGHWVKRPGGWVWVEGHWG
jgi:WXXGXW repeat (2 copies)